MDQVVFVFDLEQIVPLEGITGELDEGLLEEELNNVISAALKIATFCTDAGRLNDSRRDLPSLGFRFYSSTEYFSVPPQLTGDWYDLSLSSWDTLEGSLHERFESVLAAVRRSKL